VVGENVRPAGQGGNVADLRQYSVEEATELTGITKQQVSRRRKGGEEFKQPYLSSLMGWL
jgi:hypothetical protein